MWAARRVSEWRPLPPTPTSIACPRGWRRTRQILARCSSANLKEGKDVVLSEGTREGGEGPVHSLSVCVSVSLCLFPCLPLFLSLFVYRSLSLSVNVCLYLSISLTLSLCLSISLSIFASLSVSLSLSLTLLLFRIFSLSYYCC